jgi:hypothetical protein
MAYDGRSFYAYAIPGAMADASKGVALNGDDVQYDLRVEYETADEAAAAARVASFANRQPSEPWTHPSVTVAQITVPNLDEALSDLGEGVLSKLCDDICTQGYQGCSDDGEGWHDRVRVNGAHDDELEAALHRVIFKWLQRRDLLPNFCFVDDEEELSAMPVVKTRRKK